MAQYEGKTVDGLECDTAWGSAFTELYKGTEDVVKAKERLKPFGYVELLDMIHPDDVRITVRRIEERRRK